MAGQAFGCGQCMSCRLNKKRLWMHRIMLESRLHEHNTFVTLTYSDDHLPEGGSLAPRHTQIWLKKLRKHLESTAFNKVRYYLVGEYGDKSQRPHYHVALFGYPSCARGRSSYTSRRTSCCQHCDLIRDTWGYGQVYLGDLTTDSAQYIAGYVTKKMTAKDDPRLNGRHPEFARMSLRPGIGADAVHDIASALLTFGLDLTEADVPVSLRHGKKILPLGRYLRKKLRLALGKDEKCPDEVLIQMAQEMRSMQLAIKNDPENPSIKRKIVDDSKQPILNMTANERSRKNRRIL
ncbi:replication initiator protein [Apis mellifera associated microvirus 43]|nr:replication initiator protein [Apis mellifera associated microvirus 43]